MAKKTKKSREWHEKHGFEFMIPLEKARKIVDAFTKSIEHAEEKYGENGCVVFSFDPSQAHFAIFPAELKAIQ